MNRLCAAARRTGSCAFVMISLGLASLAIFIPSVVAQERGDDEVSIGTFTFSAPQSKPRSNGSPSPVGGPIEERREASRAPQVADGGKTLELFEEALAALNEGRSDAAQRLFEQLIAQAPDSNLASEARGHLAELYRAQPRNTLAENVPSALGEAKAPRPLSGIPSNPGIGGSAVPAGRDYSQGTDVSAAIEEQFIAEAGDRVFFSEGSAELGGRARGVLKAQARFIKLRPGLSATIEGHADDGPLSVDEHARLSEARAEAVRRRLIEEGVESERLAVSAWGRDKRVSACPEPSCMAQNRRVVTILVGARAGRMGGPVNGAPGGAAVIAREPALLTH